jgi:hypothetical protein
MNREQRRAAERRKPNRDKHGKEKIEQMMLVHKIAKYSVSDHTEPKDFNEGDKVTINISSVKSRPNYIHMNEKYKEFVDDSEGKVFTVKYDNGTKNLITFEENDMWLFWSGDLELYNPSDEE